MIDLRAIVRIKTMAQAAIGGSERPGIDESLQIVAAYERLRDEARALNERAGWGTGEDFDRELPPLNASLSGGRNIAVPGSKRKSCFGYSRHGEPGIKRHSRSRNACAPMPMRSPGRASGEPVSARSPRHARRGSASRASNLGRMEGRYTVVDKSLDEFSRTSTRAP